MFKRLIFSLSFVLVLSLTLGLTNAGPIKQVVGPDLVVIEAENFHNNISQGDHEWQLATDPEGFSGTGFMRAMPDSGANVQRDYVTLSPRLDFEVDFVKTGTHYVWIRYLKTGGEDDSCHIGIDGQEGSGAENISASGSDNTWNWSNERRGDLRKAKLEVTSTGVHTVNVWMREDGFRLDKINLTTDGSYTPSDEVPSVEIIPTKVEPKPIITKPIEPEPVKPKAEPEETKPEEPKPAEVTPVPDLLLKRIVYEIGPEFYSFEYEEPGYMKEEGIFYGVALSATYRGWVPNSPKQALKMMVRGEGRFAFGQVDYDGGIIDPETGEEYPLTIKDIDDFAMEGRLLLGPEWLISNILSTSYAGIGYRYLNDDSSSDPYGYERESNYYYVPIGFEIDTDLQAGWSLAGGIEYDYFLWGLQRSHIFPTIIENEQNSGYGYRASIKLQKKSKDVNFVIEPFFRYWDIDDSEIEYNIWGAGLEPANETTEYGIQLILMY